MVTNRRKKNSRLRGSHTHGWGSKKKHRGSGHRGGRGRAGSGKRADAKKPSIWKDPSYFGKHGFIPHGPRSASKGISIKTLEDSLQRLYACGAAHTTGNTITINLSQAGYTKLLSTGTPTKKLTIHVDCATPAAITKIQKSGGSVTLPIQDTATKE